VKSICALCGAEITRLFNSETVSAEAVAKRMLTFIGADKMLPVNVLAIAPVYQTNKQPVGNKSQRCE